MCPAAKASPKHKESALAADADDVDTTDVVDEDELVLAAEDDPGFS